MGVYRKAPKEFFVRGSDWTSGNVFILKEDRFLLDIMKKFFTLMVLRH